MALSRPPILFAVVAFALTQCATRAVTPRQPGPDEDVKMTPASLYEARPASEHSLDGQGTPVESARQLSMHQIAMVTSSAHSAAIDQARVAYSKAANRKVKQLAQLMLADHAQLETAERNLYVDLDLSPEDSPLATDIGVQSSKALFDLRDAESGSVDRVYVDATIAWLEKIEGAIDEQLIPSAREPRLKELLGRFKERVSVELGKAREAEEELKGDVEMKVRLPTSKSPVR